MSHTIEAKVGDQALRVHFNSDWSGTVDVQYEAAPDELAVQIVAISAALFVDLIRRITARMAPGEDELKAIEERSANFDNYQPGAEGLQLAKEDVPALVAEVRRLRVALVRLGSSEAFTVAMALGTGPEADELRARIDYARAALDKDKT